MSSNEITIRLPIELDESQKIVVSKRAPKSGWGVLRNTGGIAEMTAEQLISIWAEQAEADQEASGLNEREAVVEYEISGDPESNVYHEVWFSTQQLALNGISTQLVAVAKYQRVET